MPRGRPKGSRNKTATASTQTYPKKATGFKKTTGRPTGTSSAFNNAYKNLKKYAAPFIAGKNKTKQYQSATTTPTTSYLRATALAAKYHKRPAMNYLNKIVNANIQKQIWRWSGINEYANTTVAPLNAITSEVGGGAYWLHNKIDSIGNRFVPTHFFNLTSVGQQSVTAGAATFNPTYQLAFTSANIPTFYPLINQLPDGSPGSGVWEVEDIAQDINYLVQSPLRRCLLKSCDIKLLLYGARNHDTRIKITLMQFKKDSLDPLHQLQNPLTNTGLDLDNDKTYYQHLTKPFTAHPISDELPGIKQSEYMRVLKQWNFTIEAGETDEIQNAVPHMKNIRLWLPMDRILKLDWKNANPAALADLNDPGAYTKDTGLQLQNTVEPKARIYLMIQAFNKTQTNYTNVESFNQTSSYDIRIRNTYQMLDG